MQDVNKSILSSFIKGIEQHKIPYKIETGVREDAVIVFEKADRKGNFLLAKITDKSLIIHRRIGMVGEDNVFGEEALTCQFFDSFQKDYECFCARNQKLERWGQK